MPGPPNLYLQMIVKVDYISLSACVRVMQPADMGVQ